MTENGNCCTNAIMIHFARNRMPKPKRADGDRGTIRTASVFTHDLTKVVESEKSSEDAQ